MVLYYFFVKRRMLVSARRIGVPRKTERSDVLWGERLADLFKDKHTPKCHLRFFVDILKLWVIVTLSLSNITSRTKAFTISFRTGISCISHKEPSSSNSISCRRQGTCNRAVSLAQYRSLVLLC